MANLIRIKEQSVLARFAAWKLNCDQVAMVLGSTIHLYGCTKKDFLSNIKWLRHEVAHVQQWQKFGSLKFAIAYLVESSKKGYYANKFEVEAREREDDSLILEDIRII